MIQNRKNLVPGARRFALVFLSKEFRILQTVMTIFHEVWSEKGFSAPALNSQIPLGEDFFLESSHSYFTRFLGTELSLKRIREALASAGISVEEREGGILRARIPAFRRDLFTEQDLVEEIAIGTGLQEIEQLGDEKSSFNSSGAPSRKEEVKERLRLSLARKGFHEMILMTLSSESSPPSVLLQNPLGDSKSLRRSLLPGLLSHLSSLGSRELPQSFFEIGESAFRDSEGSLHEESRLAGVVMNRRNDFNELLSVVEELMKERRLSYSLQEGNSSEFIPGRCFEVFQNGHSIGYAGEIIPSVLVNHKLSLPVMGFELRIVVDSSESLWAL